MTSNQAGIYCRISRDAEEEGLGVARQEQDCRDLATRLGLDAVEVYVDNDISASTLSRKSRPAYARLLADATAGRIDAVLSYSNSRLTRRPRELEDLIDLHAATGVVISTVVSGMDDLSTADGRLTARIKANVDASEAERTAERVVRAHKQIAESGRYIGPRPFGYDFATDDHGRVLTGKAKQLVVNSVEAEAIKEAVRRVLAREAIWSIANDFNARGIETASGGQWHTQTFRRMLLRWVHAGYRKHQRFEDGRFVGTEELHKAGWDAIIDRATHEQVVARLTDPNRRTSRSTEAKYLLTSIAECGACGGYLVGTAEFRYRVKGSYVRKDGTRSPDKTRVYQPSYKCPHAGCQKVSRRMNTVDEFVTRVVVELLEREGLNATGADTAAAESARERIAALEAKLALITDEWTADKITDGQMTRATATLRPQLDAELARLHRAQPMHELAGFTGPGAEAAWAVADVQDKKAILRTLREMVGLTITVDPIGSGVFSSSDTSRYSGIRIERDDTSRR